MLALAATSPAVELRRLRERTVDQRGVPRPQGALCDAGAYELDPPPETSVEGGGPPFAFSASDPGSTFECSLDGGPFSAVHVAVERADRAGLAHAHGPRGRSAGQRGRHAGHALVRRSRRRNPSRNRSRNLRRRPWSNKTVVGEGGLGPRARPAAGKPELRRARRRPRASRSARRVDTKRGTVELTSVPTRRRRAGDGGVLRRDLPGHAVARDHRPQAHRGARALPEAQRPRGGEEAQVAQAVGQGQRQVPHDRQLQRRHDPRHGVAGSGLVRGDADAGSGGHCLGA